MSSKDEDPGGGKPDNPENTPSGDNRDQEKFQHPEFYRGLSHQRIPSEWSGWDDFRLKVSVLYF